MSARLSAAAGLIALSMGASACGGDDEKKAGGTAAKPEPVEIEASPGGVLSVPSSVTTGVVEVSLTNSDKADHEAQLVKLEGGHKVADAIKAIESAEEKGLPEWLRGAGGVGSTPGGKTQKVTQTLEPGRYGVFDMEGERPLSGEFEVTGEGSSSALPGTDASVVASDYAFSAKGLTAGSSEVTFKNTGKELHHLIALRMNEGATIAQVKEFLGTENAQGKPPIQEQGGESTAVLDGNQQQVVNIDLKAGRYAFVCFITDRKGGPPHVAKGMLNEVEVAE